MAVVTFFNLRKEKISNWILNGQTAPKVCLCSKFYVRVGVEGDKSERRFENFDFFPQSKVNSRPNTPKPRKLLFWFDKFWSENIIVWFNFIIKFWHLPWRRIFAKIWSWSLGARSCFPRLFNFIWLLDHFLMIFISSELLTATVPRGRFTPGRLSLRHYLFTFIHAPAL